MLLIVMATFIGTPTLGYQKGHVYKLIVEGNSVMRLDHTGFCPYRSLRAFLRNWTNVRVIDPTE